MHAGRSFDARTQPLVEVAQPLPLVTVSARVHGDDDGAVRPEAGVYVPQVLQGSDEQAGADEQQQ